MSIASAEQLTLTLPRLRVSGLAWRRGAATNVLAFHGWMDNAASFARLAPLLDDCCVVAIDLAGHGRSDHRPTGYGYHFGDYVIDAFAVADALGWDQFALLGHSLGAAVASHAAGVFPERITRLALIEGLGPDFIPDERLPEHFASYIKQCALGEAPSRSFSTPDEALDAMMRAAPMARASAALLAERGVHRGESASTWKADPQLARFSPLRVSEGQTRAFLGRITCPTLLVLASDSWLRDSAIVAERARCIRDLERVEVAGGHHVHLDAAETLAPMLHGFFKG